MISLLFMGAALAASLSLDLDTHALTVGETVPLQLTLVEGVARGVPEVPAGGGLSLEFSGQSQQRMVVNFKSTRLVQYNYALTATAPGTWQVGPVELVVDGQTLTAPAISVEVAPRSEAARAERDVSATLSETEPWLGQVVVYRFKFEHQGELLDARWTAPAFEGFVNEPMAEAAQSERSLQRDGVPYTIREIDVPLVATGEGKRTISPAMLAVQVPVERKRRGRDPLAGTPFSRYTDVTTETLTASAVPATVRPLPTEGKPLDFTGLVGHFALKATPSTNEVRLGESVTLELELSGDGSLSGFRLPPPPAGAGYRAYDDDPEVAARISDGAFLATAKFRRAIVPESEGLLSIPPYELSVFDPTVSAYVTLRSEPLEIRVLPGESGAGVVTSYGSADARRDVERLGEDILPAPLSARVADQTLKGAIPLALTLPALPLLGLIGLGLAGRVRSRKRDPWLDLRAALASLPPGPVERLAALEDLFREAAGLRLGLPAAGLERASVAPLGEDVTALYADLERARYGGMSVEDLEPRVRRFVEAGP